MLSVFTLNPDRLKSRNYVFFLKKNHVRCVLLFYPFNTPLVKSLQWFPFLLPADEQQDVSERLFPFLFFAFPLSSRQKDRYHSFNCACSNKEETGRVCPQLISLAQIPVVGSVSLPPPKVIRQTFQQL